MEEKTVKKPICLELVEAKADIFAAINNAAQNRGIPFYLLESIVEEAARQVSECARKEREIAKRTYEEELANEKCEEGE